MGKEFPVVFNFKAFETVNATIDKVTARFDGLKSSVSDFNNRFAILQSKTKGVRDALTSAGGAMESVGKKLTLGVTAPLALLAGKMVHTSIAAEESASKFEQVFKEVDNAVKGAAVDRLRKSFDLSTQSAHEMLSTTGLLAKDLGLTGDQALNMSEQVTGLSVQMAAFRNIEGGTERATEILRAAMLGQTKGLKALGISITEAQIKEEARAMSQKGARFETVEQAKAMATLALIQKRTIDDQEDFKNSQNEMENQLRVTGEQFKEISKTIGDILKPVLAAILNVANRLMKAFLNLSPSMQKVIVAFAAIAAAVGPLLVALGFFVGTILPALITGFSVLTVFAAPFSGTILAIVAAVTALIAVGVMLVKNWESVKGFFSALWDGPLFKVIRFMSGIDLLIGAGKLILKNWEPIAAFFDSIFDSVKGIFGVLGDLGGKLLFGNNSPFGGGNQNAQGNLSEQSTGMKGQAQEIGKAMAQEIRTTNDAKVQLDFLNLPRGTKISSQASGIPPSLNLGMMGAPL